MVVRRPRGPCFIILDRSAGGARGCPENRNDELYQGVREFEAVGSPAFRRRSYFPPEGEATNLRGPPLLRIEAPDTLEGGVSSLIGGCTNSLGDEFPSEIMGPVGALDKES